MSQRTLIKGGTLITMDPTLGTMPNADVLIERGHISRVGPAIDDAEPTSVIDATNHFVLPGFVDTHRHTWQSQLRGIASDWTLNQYITGVRKKLGPLYRPEDVYAGTLLGCAEALDAGVTTVVDWAHIMNSPEYADASVAALRDFGGRAVFAHGTPTDKDLARWYVDSDLPHPEDIRRVRTAYFSSDDQLVTLAMAARGPDRSTMEITRRDWKLARDLGIGITAHVGVGVQGQRSQGIRRLHEEGLLGSDTTYIHANTSTDDELALVRDSGGSLSIAPEVEMHMGLGYPPVDRAIGLGIDPSLSIDVVVAISGDMFAVMRAALASARARLNDEAMAAGQAVDRITITTADVLRFATIAGARACGLGDKIGALRPGMEADVILIRRDGLNLSPTNSPTGSVVLAARPNDVETVLVRGTVVKQHGRLISIDPSTVMRLAEESRDRLLQRAGISLGWEPTDALEFSRGFG